MVNLKVFFLVFSHEKALKIPWKKNHEKALKTSIFMAHNSWPMNCPTHTEDNEISRKLCSWDVYDINFEKPMN